MLIHKNIFALLVCLCICVSLFGQSKQPEKILRIAQEMAEGPEEIVIKKLGGGLTNDNYKVSIGSTSYFFRSVNHTHSVLGSSLEREWIITTYVSKSSIAPKVISYHPKDGILVTEFIQTTGGKVDLRNNATMLSFCRIIDSLHKLKVEFPMLFDPYLSIENSIQSALEKSVDLPDDLLFVVHPKISAFDKNSPPSLNHAKVPAHLDLHAGNILDDGKQLWLIDWEYAAMADPYFDLATVTSVENFSNQEMKMLLERYLKRSSSENEFNYFLKMRILADTRWALWSYIQAKDSPLDEPFKIMGDTYLDHALTRAKDFIE